MNTKYIFFVIIFSVITLLSYGQSCSDYHKTKGRWADESFLYSRQSRSALYTPGMASEFSITVYGGEEYYVSVNADKKLGKIKIRVKEDNKSKNVLYDNSNYEYEGFFFFKNENTRNLIIEVSSEADKTFSNSSDRYCVGVLIEFRVYEDKRAKTGF